MADKKKNDVGTAKKFAGVTYENAYTSSDQKGVKAEPSDETVKSVKLDNGFVLDPNTV